MICYHGSTLSTRPTMDDKQIKHHHHGINISFSWQVSAFSIDVFVVVIVIVIIGNIHPLSMSQPPLCLFGFRHDISVLSIRIQSNVTCYLINDGFARWLSRHLVVIEMEVTLIATAGCYTLVFCSAGDIVKAQLKSYLLCQLPDHDMYASNYDKSLGDITFLNMCRIFAFI